MKLWHFSCYLFIVSNLRFSELYLKDIYILLSYKMYVKVLIWTGAPSSFFTFAHFPPLSQNNALIISTVCLLLTLTWARNLRPDVMTAPNSHTSISHTAGWRGWWDDSGVSPALVPFLRLLAAKDITWRTGEVFSPPQTGAWFPFPLIWLLVGGLKKLKLTKGLEKSRDRGNLSVVVVLCTGK